ncbi:hypothetical protein LDK12_11275 [Fusobacterium pseudoperiodonticum]|jgi:hypothetical protein|uniref:tetratricopeptide repeat protein n=1 Tax=Fusobacterium pseudoperiodonticum TaxID=2663009 RepID=UPI002064B735|nr:MAG TPA: Soluble NSF attachment protein, SNAP [Caudoviricetes sp.]
MSLLNGKEYLLTTLPPKYDISTATNQILLGGQKLKRLGKYEEAQEIYNYILSTDGASGILYIAMAKNLACNAEYDKAIKLLELANQSCIKEFDIVDENCLYHIEQLLNRNTMGKEKFLEYMKSIAGNPNYNFPK